MAFARHPVFPSQKRSKTPAPIRVDFYIGSASPFAGANCSALGLAVGFRPPRPRLSGVPFSKERISLRLSESWRSGKAFAPSQAPHLALPLGRDHAPGGRLNRK